MTAKASTHTDNIEQCKFRTGTFNLGEAHHHVMSLFALELVFIPTLQFRYGKAFKLVGEEGVRGLPSDAKRDRLSRL